MPSPSYTKYMFYADFHLHTNYSDGELSIRELVDLMGRQGIGAIAITDHLCEQRTFLGKSARLLSKTLSSASFPYYMETILNEAHRAWRDYGMLVIPGVEITKNSFSHKDSAHILALDIHNYIDPDQSVEDIIAAIHAQKGLAIAAHPVSTGVSEHQTYALWNNREKYSELFDAWEVASGPLLFKEVRQSGLPVIANSDLHKAHQIESWKTIFTVEKDIEAIKKAIRTQDLRISYFRPQEEEESITPSPRSRGQSAAHWPLLLPLKI